MDTANDEVNANASSLRPEEDCPSWVESRPWEEPAVERNFVNDIPAYIGKGDNSPVWPLYNDKAKEIHGKLIEGWDKDMDVLLVFSALFSAVVTAFIVLSVAMLSPDPSQQAVDALTVISAQLSALSALNAPRSAPPVSYQASAFVPSTSSVGINVLWALSLTISLFTAVLAMLAKQWLRNYASDLSSAPAEQARQRYTRFEGVLAWNIPAIVTSLPIFLHIAVFAFLIGLLVFLWPSSTVLTATMATIWLAGAAAYFFFALGPVIWTNCPYTSPLTYALEFCTSLRLQTSSRTRELLMLLASLEEGKPWWNLPGNALRLCRFASAHVCGRFYVDYPWLAQRAKRETNGEQQLIDSGLMGWLERICTDQSEKETVLCASFGWEPHKIFGKFQHNFALTAARAVARLIQPELGYPDCFGGELSPSDVEHLLVRLAIYTKYGEGFGRDLGWEALCERSWTDLSAAKGEDIRSTLLRMGALLFTASNHRGWWYTVEEARLEQMYDTVLPEFCRAFTTPGAQISLLGCWLLLQHLGIGVSNYDPSDARVMPSCQQFSETLQCLVATSEDIPSVFLDSVKLLWCPHAPTIRITEVVYDNGSIPTDFCPILGSGISWLEALKRCPHGSERLALMSYIIHNSHAILKDGHFKTEEAGERVEAVEQSDTRSALVLYILETPGLKAAIYPQRIGRLPSTEDLKASYSLELRILEVCILEEDPSLPRALWTTAFSAGQLFPPDSEIFRFVTSRLTDIGFDRSPQDLLVTSDVFAELIRCARCYRDSRTALLTTQLVKNTCVRRREPQRTDPDHGQPEWGELLMRTGWLDMLVEYAYTDVLRLDSDKCSILQEAIVNQGECLVPYLGPLAKVWQEYPCPINNASFEDLMQRAAEYTPPLNHRSSPAHVSRWRGKTVVERRRLLKLSTISAEVDVEHSTPVSLDGSTEEDPETLLAVATSPRRKSVIRNMR